MTALAGGRWPVPFWMKHPQLHPDLAVSGISAMGKLGACYWADGHCDVRLGRYARNQLSSRKRALWTSMVGDALPARCDCTDNPSFAVHSADYVCEPTDMYTTTE